MIYIISGLLFALIGVANLTTGRLHPERPNARLSRGMGYIGIIVGLITFVFGLAIASGVLVPPPLPQPPAPASAPANVPVNAAPAAPAAR